MSPQVGLRKGPRNSSACFLRHWRAESYPEGSEASFCLTIAASRSRSKGSRSEVKQIMLGRKMCFHQPPKQWLTCSPNPRT